MTKTTKATRAPAGAKPSSAGTAGAKQAGAKPGSVKKASARQAGAKTERKTERAGTRLLDPIFDAIRKRAGKARQDDASAFASAFYLRMGEDEMPMHGAEGWAALANDFLDFARSRKPGTPSVRLFNPTLAKHGWESPHTVLQIVNDDMPFLVDSVTMALAERGVGVHVLGHPVVRIARDRAGRLTAVGEGTIESMMHLEIDRQSAAGAAEIEQAVLAVLADVRAIVADWPSMRQKMLDITEDLAKRRMPIGEAGREEAREFLRWAAADHFTFLGYREYRVRKQGKEEVLAADAGTGLGLLRGREGDQPRKLSTLAAHSMQQAGGAADALILTKTNARANVHRPGYMDYIGVLSFDADGRPVAEQRFIGLYTSSAYNRRPWEIPLVRERHDYVMQTSGLLPTGHSGKALRHILEKLPRDELFQSTGTELYQLATGILGLQERVRSRVFLRHDRYGRFYSVLAYIPRDRYNTEIRLRIEAMLKDVMHADRVDSTIQLGDSPLAQLHMLVRPRKGEAIDVEVAAIDARLSTIVRNWQDDLREQLVARQGEERGLALANGYGRALPAGYIQKMSVAGAADDVEQLAALTPDDDLRLSLCRDQDGVLRFKFYRLHDDIPLSDALPMMENMGLRVISEHPYRIESEGAIAYIQDFEVQSTRGEINVDDLDETFEDAFAQMWRGNAENDGFNRLILAAGLSWRQVSMLRAYCKYLLQVGVPFSQSYIEDTFGRYPVIARLLTELFEARFDPATGSETKADIGAGMDRFRAQLSTLSGGDAALLAAVEPVIAARAAGRDAQLEATRQAITALLDRVSSLDDDRILRGFVSVIEATLRTNYYIRYRGGRYKDGRRADGGPADYLSFKFDPSKVPDLPKPRPYREIFVCGPRVEGVHLRFGPVARGGLRWSDRREDFRTEVLGLVKAQMVKNTVIVPVGSKGGFICKQLPDPAVDRDAWFNEGVACYKRFINGLLDITDNLSTAGKIVAPAEVVRHDGDDPYLVVAADKGTATFSDIANGIANAHGFWLDDAFASGGSVGYDHKGMGITARGGWESVKRHFRAMGRDCQAEDFTCAGVGDMSGDVFGNGMLLSRHIRLLAAFDHRHIFLDPNPDAAVSFKERERMFALPRSSWDDYDRALIARGGGVWPRSAKAIPLSAEAKAALGIESDATSISPMELMHLILKAPVDLLWNGGIGTYVKSSAESHADVGDRANNGLRVNGGELRCKVVGEGGNLGLTQLGRIEAGLSGVLLNTDFIDNSAGVDTSDHEVNIKILLNAEVQRKKLTMPERNKLLAGMTDEVAALVLNDNYRQNQALSLMQRMSLSRLGSKQHFIRTLESQGLLDRQIEFLPSDAEIADRKARRLGLTRPELSVLLSYSKIVLFQQLLESDVPEDPFLSKELVRYFPAPLQKKYAKAMENHRLKREIIATAVTNSMVNRMGASFTLRMTEDTGRTPGEVAKVFTITRETLDARELWTQIDALDGKVPESVQVDALQVIWNLQRSMTRWLLSRPGPIPGITAAVERYHDGFREIRAGSGILPAAMRPALDASYADWIEKGLPEPLAKQLAALPYLEWCCDIIELARARKLKPVDVARAHFRLGDALKLPWLYAQIDTLAVDGRWHAVARGSLRDELATQQRLLTTQVLDTPGANADAKVAQWLGREDGALRFTLGMLGEVAAQKTLDYPTASVAVRRLSMLSDPG